MLVSRSKPKTQLPDTIAVNRSDFIIAVNALGNYLEALRWLLKEQQEEEADPEECQELEDEVRMIEMIQYTLMTSISNPKQNPFDKGSVN